MRKSRPPVTQDIPLDIVGSTVYGRYPKISVEQTWNMIISDGWLVPYAGYEKSLEIAKVGEGRGIFNSTRLGRIIACIDDGIYLIDKNLSKQKIGSLQTFSGDVIMDENDNSQIAICDKSTIYIYDWGNNTFTQQSLDFIPGYVTFHDGRFIAPALGTNTWRLSDSVDGVTTWPSSASFVGSLQTKPDDALAVVRMPGGGSLIFVFGKVVCEPWFDVGAQLFPYQRSSSFSVDYGCLNPATIATSDNLIVWLGANEKSGPVIMYSTGGSATPIQQDGIDFKFGQIKNPEQSYGFLFKQDGHLIYQLTFSGKDDNLTFAYDFNTKKFFCLSDTNQEAHIAKRIVFFNNTYFFVSFIDGNLYEMSSKYTTFDGEEIPRIRICNTIRAPSTNPFIINSLTFPIEQGQDEEIPRVDLSISTDGGEGFGNTVGMKCNHLGYRKNRFTYWNCGYANEFIPQFRFWSQGRVVAGNGTVSIYQ